MFQSLCNVSVFAGLKLLTANSGSLGSFITSQRCSCALTVASKQLAGQFSAARYGQPVLAKINIAPISTALQRFSGLDEMAIIGPHIKKPKGSSHMDGKPFMKGIVLKVSLVAKGKQRWKCTRR